MGQTAAEESTHAHQGGLMLAVRATPDTEEAIVEAMRAAGIEHVERTRGEWRDGHWADFDPKQQPDSVER
jgi:hypothetical protein